MFSELRSRWSIQRRNSNEPLVTSSEVSELQTTVNALRKQLHQLVDNEIASNNEACGVATNGMVLLRNELEKKRTELRDLQYLVEDGKDELGWIEHKCIQEKEQRKTCQEDVVKMQADTDKARKEIINLQAEMKQMTYFQEVVDTETKYRLQADVQNLETDRERDHIRLRHLKRERDGLQSELEELKKERDAIQFVANEREKELSEAKMTREMYQTHHETLTTHLQKLGDPRNMFGSLFNQHSFRGFFKERRIRASIDEGIIKQDDPIPEGRRNSELVCKGKDQTSDQQPERMKLHDQSERSKQLSAHVGGIVLGADATSSKSSDFHRKLPTIFKLGESNDINTQDYGTRRSKLEREVEFPLDTSISNISQLTLDDEAWADMADEPRSDEEGES